VSAHAHAGADRWSHTGRFLLLRRGHHRDRVADLDAARRTGRDGDAIVDFAGVTEADSAALALIFKWQRDAAHTAARSAAEHPANVMALAKLYG
jgi:ABC-type transporter Mla MlaB component